MKTSMTSAESADRAVSFILVQRRSNLSCLLQVIPCPNKYPLTHGWPPSSWSRTGVCRPCSPLPAWAWDRSTRSGSPQLLVRVALQLTEVGAFVSVCALFARLLHSQAQKTDVQLRWSSSDLVGLTIWKHKTESYLASRDFQNKIEGITD